MFGTSIHWTTFFYLLVDTFIVLIVSIRALNLKRPILKRYLILGLLFIAYNLTGGFMPIEEFPAPLILQYTITYSVAIILCVYLAYYLYKEYDIAILRVHLSIRNIIILMAFCFIFLFLVPFHLTASVDIARACFTVPIAGIAIYFLWAFKERIKKRPESNSFSLRRNNLSVLCVCSIALLPILTIIGDYQWLTFTVMNAAFFATTTMEIDRYHHFLENKNRMFEVLAFYKANKEKLENSKLIYQSLTSREIEISLCILSNKSYKKIGDYFFITERTVSKHASNIFKKTGVKNRVEFLKRFNKRTKK